MKVVIVLCLAIFGLAYGANNKIQNLISHEVHAIMTADKDLTVDHCSTKCDALFDLVDPHDEHATDKMCKNACICEIQGTHCPGQHATHAPGHSTHMPHHTHTHKPHTTAPATAAPPAPTTTTIF